MSHDPLPACSCSECFWGEIKEREAPIYCLADEEYHAPDDCCAHYQEPAIYNCLTGLPFGREGEG